MTVFWIFSVRSDAYRRDWTKPSLFPKHESVACAVTRQRFDSHLSGERLSEVTRRLLNGTGQSTSHRALARSVNGTKDKTHTRLASEFKAEGRQHSIRLVES